MSNVDQTDNYQSIPREDSTEHNVINRLVVLNEIQSTKFCTNKINTGKYSVLTFIPKFLFEQFRKYANVYFLIIALFQQIPNVSPTGRFTTVVPLTFILIVSAVKELIEDYKRHSADDITNHTKSLVLRDGHWVEILWKNIKVGDVIKVINNHGIPADTLLLASSEPMAMCYIETSNLDGETNLKLRQGLKITSELLTPNDLMKHHIKIECEKPNRKLDEFVGTLYTDDNTSHPLQSNQLLLRGSFLKNTNWIFGLVLYTGKDSKVMLNSLNAPLKRSTVDKKTNIFILILFAILLFLTVFTVMANAIWTISYGENVWYLGTNALSLSGVGFMILTAFIIFHTIIPISLQVTLEVIRFIQALFINWDIEMYNSDTDSPAMARTSNLNEELGQVKHVFTDKTGTLTQNVMVFKRCSVAGKMFGGETENSNAFTDQNLITQIYSEDKETDLFFTLLAVCHTVVPEIVDTDLDDQKLIYQASSPDENALVMAAKQLNYVFSGRTPDNVTIVIKGDPQVFSILHVLEFTSSRKRMSVIIEDSDHKLILMVKGADMVIYDRLSDKSLYQEETLKHLEEFAKSGLRTLCIAYAEISRDFYNQWKQKYASASTVIENREARLEEVAEEIEKNLMLLGATAIEDKLQEGVPDTISNLLQASISVWMLTGDKQETAINIGYSCKLITQSQTQFILNANTLDGTREQLTMALHSLQDTLGSTNDVCLIINGKTLDFALSCDCRKDFLDISLSCAAVICCRVSPWQKAEIVRLVRSSSPDITLAIGDGANDVGMIQAAHVGIGISGLEGMQAACSSDYAFAQFRFLKRLLFVHGAWNYSRVTKVVFYSFYKNICLYFVQFWFAIVSGFSAQIIFERWSMALYNVVFSAAPPLALGLFDRNCSARSCMEYPQLYRETQCSRTFDYKVFFIWLLNATIHSAIIFWFTLFAFKSEILYSNGQTTSLLVLGNSVYTYVVITVSLKAGLEHTAWTVFSHLAIWGSIVLWFLFLSVYPFVFPTFNLASEMVGMETAIYGCPTFWLCLLLVPFVALTRDFTYKVIKRSVSQTLREQVMLMEQLNMDLKQYIPAVTESPLLNEKASLLKLLRRGGRHKLFQLQSVDDSPPTEDGGDLGFAFSQEEGGVVSQSEVIRRYNTTAKKPAGI